MSIIHANEEHLETVKAITISTISRIYPHYYPKGAVDFFLAHHNEEIIFQDIQSGFVYLNVDQWQNAVGTVTLRTNEICRLFVLPQYQGRGLGRELLDFAEDRISEQNRTAVLDASLPAKSIYVKRGYIEVEARSIRTASGDYLCYDVMRKSFFCHTWDTDFV